MVVTSYQRRELLRQAIDSVLAQTLEDREVIVADDESTDGTLEDLRSLPVQVVRLAHSGVPAVTRNAGMARARGDLITFLDCDDVWRPTILEELARALDEHPEVGFAWCASEPEPSPAPPDPPVGDMFDRLLETNLIVTSGVMIRKPLTDLVGQFDSRLRVTEDWDYFLRMAARAAGAYVPRCLTYVRPSPDSLSRAPGGVIYGENIQVTRKALMWCRAHRPSSLSNARRAYRRSIYASARYAWHRRAIRRTVRDMVTLAFAR